MCVHIAITAYVQLGSMQHVLAMTSLLQSWAIRSTILNCLHDLCNDFAKLSPPKVDYNTKCSPCLVKHTHYPT
jgi:hypothetical protein